MASYRYGGGLMKVAILAMSYTWQVFGKLDTSACSVGITGKVVVLQS
jgi:hypothetical protein